MNSLKRPLAAGALLMAIYMGLSLLNDPRGYLGTDTGGKVATLKAMERRGDLRPDVGYWAESWDPSGRVHPMPFTSSINGQWVTVSTLPMLYASYPLYRVGGLRAILLFPMLGAILAAFAARRLALYLGHEDGWIAFWVVGLASPITIYALDFWEHSLGVGLVAWGIVLLLESLDAAKDGRSARRLASRWFFAGLLFGAAATMRTESLVYAAVAGALAGIPLLLSRRAVAFLPALAVAVGLLVPLAANAGIERQALGKDLRQRRTVGMVEAVGSKSDAGPSRIEEAVITSLSSNLVAPGDYVFGGLLVFVLGYAALRARTGATGPAKVAAMGVVVGYLRTFATGVRFLPGMLIATPLAVVGLAQGFVQGRDSSEQSRSRRVIGVAVIALPLVWGYQFLGGAHPQWAGRYILVSGLLLGVVGLVSLGSLPSWARVGAISLTCMVTAFGLLWLKYRSHDVARVMEVLRAREEPVLIFRNEHFPREGGAFPGGRWLTADDDQEERFAAQVALRAGYSELAIVDIAPAHPERRSLPGFGRVGNDKLSFLGKPYRIVSYRALKPESTDPPSGGND